MDGGGGGGDKGEPEEDHPLQRLISPLISVFQLVIRSSYIATNIVMMVSVANSVSHSQPLGHFFICILMLLILQEKKEEKYSNEISFIVENKKIINSVSENL